MPTQRANHTTPFVEEYYETGTIDKDRMRDLVSNGGPVLGMAGGLPIGAYDPELSPDGRDASLDHDPAGDVRA